MGARGPGRGDGRSGTARRRSQATSSTWARCSIPARCCSGRRTWQLFSKIWPGRDDEFSAKMNAMPKLVASRSLRQATEWRNSAVLQGDLVAAVRERKRAHDIMVTGSTSIVRTLMARDLVDEYRLLAVPAGARHG